MNLIGRFLQDAPLGAALLALFLAMAIAREAGACAHRWLAPIADGVDQSGGDEGYILSAVLGLLALLVAFTFGLALDRHEARRALVVTEADALGTAYLRADLLDGPDRLQALLRVYGEARLTYGQTSGETQAAADRRAVVLQTRIWREAVAQVWPARQTTLAPLVLQPLNDLFDTATTRRAALDARLPDIVLSTLALYVVVSAAFIGYAVTGAGGRHRIASLALFGLLCLAMGVILDLDRPREGVIRVPQAAMADTLAEMRRPPQAVRTP